MTTGLQKSAQENLRRLVDQIERLEEEKKGIADDIADKYAEARNLGFDVKIIRRVIKLRKVSKVDRDEAQSVLEIYMDALGMLSDTPLGRAAIEREFGEGAAA